MSGRRRVVYVTGTRADFGLMEATLLAIRDSELLGLAVVVTGAHLDAAHGRTLQDIEATGLPIGARVEIETGRPSGPLMAKNIGRMINGFVDAFEALRPDIVLVLGDRGEMIAAAIAALHLNLVVAHIHGGERSGTIDEPVRHAISKLAHLHLVATEESRSRLIRMGENPARVVVVGAPGLEGLNDLRGIDKKDLYAHFDLDFSRPLALLIYHPVVQEAASSSDGAKAILASLKTQGLQVVAFRPNSDAGSAEILAVLEKSASLGEIRLVTHVKRDDYLALLRCADVLIGNSSSGIIEAATFGTPVVNVGSRQRLRQRNANVYDVPVDRDAIVATLTRALKAGRFSPTNVYGDGGAASRITEQLAALDIRDPDLRAKVNAY